MPKKYSGKPKNTKEAWERIGGGLTGARAIPGSHRGNFSKGLTAEESKLMDRYMSGVELTPEQYTKLDKVADEQIGEFDDYMTNSEKRARIELRSGFAAMLLLSPSELGADDDSVQGKQAADFSEYQEPADRLKDKEEYLQQRSNSNISELWKVGGGHDLTRDPASDPMSDWDYLRQSGQVPSAAERIRSENAPEPSISQIPIGRGADSTYVKRAPIRFIDRKDPVANEYHRVMQTQADKIVPRILIDVYGFSKAADIIYNYLEKQQKRRQAEETPTSDFNRKENFIRRYPYNSKRSKK